MSNFFSLSERMEVNTSSGKLMLQILASFSEFERNNIVENVFMGANETCPRRLLSRQFTTRL